ncbi:hypothetical protein HY837_03145 [archaeon]|nr:hypothetical protein [archaeon]
MVEKISVLIGVFLLGVGSFDLYLYLTHQQKRFRKYEPMKKFWGEKTGKTLHFLSYVLLPLLFGLMSLILGLAGISVV